DGAAGGTRFASARAAAGVGAWGCVGAADAAHPAQDGAGRAAGVARGEIDARPDHRRARAGRVASLARDYFLRTSPVTCHVASPKRGSASLRAAAIKQACAVPDCAPSPT